MIVPALNPFEKKTSATCSLVLDIGSGFCKALTFRVAGSGDGEEGEEENRKIEVLGGGKIRQDLSDMSMGVPTDIASVTANIEDAVGEATFPLEGLKVSDRVLGLSGEMSSLLTTRMRLTRANPDRPISKKEIVRIEKKAQDAAFFEACKELAARKGYQDFELEIVDSAITGVEVDGFPATEPEGFKGEKVELSYFNSFAPQNRLLTLESILRNLGLKPQLVTASMYALLHTLLENKVSSGFSCIFIDVGADKTDVGIVFDSAIVASRTLPIGGREFTKAIARKLEKTFSEAEKIKCTLEDDSSDPEARSAVQDVLEVWAQGLISALQDIEEVKSLPPQINVYGGGAELGALPDYLSGTQWRKNLTFHGDPRVQVLRPAEFPFLEGEKDQVKTADWMVPLALAWFGGKVL